MSSLETSLIIEFVGKADPMVRQLLLNKDDTYRAAATAQLSMGLNHHDTKNRHRAIRLHSEPFAVAPVADHRAAL